MQMMTSQIEKDVFFHFFEVGNINWVNQAIVIFCAVYLIWILMALVAVWWWQLPRTRPSEEWPFFGKRKWLDFGVIALSVGVSFLLNYMLGFILMRERPFVQYDIIPLINIGKHLGKSFPSDHTAVAFALAWVITFLDRKRGIIFLVIALIIGIGRIMAGVHFPLDVLVGIMTGFVGTFVVWWVFRKLYKKKLL